MTLTSQTKAAEPVTTAAVVVTVAEVIGKAKAAYDAYKFFGNLINPGPTTAEVINRAVLTLSNLIIDIRSDELFADGLLVISDFRDAAAAPSAAKWQTFDRSAWDLLNRLELAIDGDNRFANDLGPMYVTVLALYLRGHLAGAQWGIQPTTTSSLANDVVVAAEKGLELSYRMVGGAKKTTLFGKDLLVDTTDDSLLYAYVKAHSKSKCFDSAEICAAYFQTNATVQAVQIAANALVGILQAAGKSMPANVGDPTVTVDPAASWVNNWHGYADAVWTPMQEYTDGVFDDDRRCPSGSGIVGIWQVIKYSPFASVTKGRIPEHSLIGFLCQKWSLLPPWDVIASSPVKLAVGADDDDTCFWSPVHLSKNSIRLCTYNLMCPNPDFLEGESWGKARCVRRLDGEMVLPTRGTCNWMKSSTGAFTALPAGSYLAGLKTGWATSPASAPMAQYYYCSLVVPLPPMLVVPLLF